jgi:hemerythrin superfamily protein
MTDTARDDIATITLSEHSRLLIASHRAMRADGKRLITATNGLQDRPPSDALALGRAFAEIVTLIHDHHWSEDDVIYPFLANRLPSFQHDAVQLERDHIDLDAAMARITARLRLLARTATPTIRYDTQQRLHDDARAFNDILIDHLDREEAIIVPSFESTISPAEQRTLEAAEAKLSTYRHIRMAVPWVLANTTADEATELRRSAPRLIRVIHDYVWKRRFQRVTAPLYRPTQHRHQRTDQRPHRPRSTLATTREPADARRPSRKSREGNLIRATNADSADIRSSRTG